MLDMENENHIPTSEDISNYIRNELFTDFCRDLETDYKAKPKIEFSKCSWEHGWNLKYKKSGKTLCTIYPRENYFTVMVVIGRREKESVEAVLTECSEEVRNIYRNTKEGNGQRWIMVDIEDNDHVCRDILKLINIRSRS